MAQLVLLQEGEATKFDLTAPETVIGRHPECHFHINSNMVSRKHARVLKDGDVFRVEDMGSGNGTFLNDQPLPPNVAQRLEPNKVYQVRLAKDENAVQMRFQYTVPPKTTSYEDEPTQV